ncbi:MAG: retropepsin-like aspartic protease family protein [Flavobacteriaceae bacterium]
MARLKKLLSKKKYVSIPLTLTETNHFEVKAKINGISGRFILDTGASNTCVGMDKADHFDLISEASEIKAAGAGARDMDTLISDQNKVEIGKWKIKKQKIVLFDLIHVNDALIDHQALPVDGIIGSDILKKAKAVIDYDKCRVFLKNK